MFWRTQGRKFLFFSQKMFFYSLGDKCQTAAPGGPSTPPPVGPRASSGPGPLKKSHRHWSGSVPQAAAKPALRHAGLYGAGLVAWIPFLTSRASHGLVRSSDRIVSRLSAGVARPGGQGSAMPLERRRRARDSPLRVYRGKPADLRKPDDRSEGLRPPSRAGRRPSLAGSLSGRKGVPKKGLIFPRTSFC